MEETCRSGGSALSVLHACPGSRRLIIVAHRQSRRELPDVLAGLLGDLAVAGHEILLFQPDRVRPVPLALRLKMHLRKALHLPIKLVAPKFPGPLDLVSRDALDVQRNARELRKAVLRIRGDREVILFGHSRGARIVSRVRPFPGAWRGSWASAIPFRIRRTARRSAGRGICRR